jgi:hypothetical protein
MAGGHRVSGCEALRARDRALLVLLAVATLPLCKQLAYASCHIADNHLANIESGEARGQSALSG